MEYTENKHRTGGMVSVCVFFCFVMEMVYEEVSCNYETIQQYVRDSVEL